MPFVSWTITGLYWRVCPKKISVSVAASSVREWESELLPIARRIAESRHGWIGIESLPVGGAMVLFELPDGE